MNAKGNVWGRLKKIVKKSIALCFTLLKNLTVLLKKNLMVRYTLYILYYTKISTVLNSRRVWLVTTKARLKRVGHCEKKVRIFFFFVAEKDIDVKLHFCNHLAK